MTRCRMVALALLFVSCRPIQSPSATYGEALRACDLEPSDDEWVDCCVKAARTYGRDPGFCFQ